MPSPSTMNLSSPASSKRPKTVLTGIRNIDAPGATDLIGLALRLVQANPVKLLKIPALAAFLVVLLAQAKLGSLPGIVGYMLALLAGAYVVDEAAKSDPRLGTRTPTVAGYVSALLICMATEILQFMLSSLGAGEPGRAVLMMALLPSMLAMQVAFLEDKMPLSAVQKALYLLKGRWIYFYFTFLKIIILLMLLLFALYIIIIGTLGVFHTPMSGGAGTAMVWISLFPPSALLLAVSSAANCVWYLCLSRSKAATLR